MLDGALKHRDSMGNGSTVHGGGVQYMSAGSGVTHAEVNASDEEPVRFLQVWLLPTERGGEPRYETLDIDAEAKRGKLALFLSPDGRDGSIASKAPALVHAATLDGDERVEHELSRAEGVAAGRARRAERQRRAVGDGRRRRDRGRRDALARRRRGSGGAAVRAVLIEGPAGAAMPPRPITVRKLAGRSGRQPHERLDAFEGRLHRGLVLVLTHRDALGAHDLDVLDAHEAEHAR